MSGKNAPLAELISLAGRRALVTGGAQGIGRAISHRLAEAGASVLIADIDAEAAQKASEELQAAGLRVDFVRADIADEESVKGMASVAVERIGGLDILVNNAGIFPRLPLVDTRTEDFARVMAVNLTGAFLCSREASRRMIEQGTGGCIINIASIDSLHPSSAELTAYDASKGGVLMLTKGMARELGQHGIRVNAIAPGGILTGGTIAQMGGQGRASLKGFMSRMALGRMGEPDDVARVALFLASDLASYMTGSLIVVDGGYLIS